jgi:protein-tyrosine phosphatase
MKNILFLCTGNTCRSPMAECLFNHISRQRGLPLSAISAGIAAKDGYPASNHAHAAMKARGLSLNRHQAQPLSDRLLKDVSLVVTMSQGHAQAFRERFPMLAVPVRVFSPPIPDPYGGSLAVYEQTAAALEGQIIALVEELAAGL